LKVLEEPPRRGDLQFTQKKYQKIKEGIPKKMARRKNRMKQANLVVD